METTEIIKAAKRLGKFSPEMVEVLAENYEQLVLSIFISMRGRRNSFSTAGFIIFGWGHYFPAQPLILMKYDDELLNNLRALGKELGLEIVIQFSFDRGAYVRVYD